MPLNKRQEKLLKKWYIEFRPKDARELSAEQFETVEQLGASETLWADVDAYLLKQQQADGSINRSPWRRG